MILRCSNPAELERISKQIILAAAEKRVLLFFGKMGAGKTTLIKNICKLLGAKEITTSPTFALVNEYAIDNYQSEIYHFDFYRLETEDEALDMGYEEYFYSGKYCLVEWPEKISGLWPENFLKISIEQEGKMRVYTIE